MEEEDSAFDSENVETKARRNVTTSSLPILGASVMVLALIHVVVALSGANRDNLKAAEMAVTRIMVAVVGLVVEGKSLGLNLE